MGKPSTKLKWVDQKPDHTMWSTTDGRFTALFVGLTPTGAMKWRLDATSTIGPWFIYRGSLTACRTMAQWHANEQARQAAARTPPDTRPHPAPVP